MSFPRNTDVSRHTERKPRRTETLTPDTRVCSDLLKSLSEDLSTAVKSAQNSVKQSDDQ